MTLTPKMVLTLFGGPSFVRVSQTLVQAEGIGSSIPYPYDDGTITSANTSDQSGMAFGFSAGADWVGHFRADRTRGATRKMRQNNKLGRSRRLWPW